MLKKVTFYFGLALAMKVNAFAWVGGPFSNGGFDSLIERNGTYQATFSFTNGSGYAYFKPDNDITPSNVNNSNTAVGTDNRSVFYYKGITFVGMATGTSDIDKRKITGYTNGYSEYTTTAATGNAQANAKVSSANAIISNTGGASYTANCNFSAKITNTHPQIRFRGKGELAIISPNGFAEASELISEFLQTNYESISDQLTQASETILDTLTQTQLPMMVIDIRPTTTTTIITSGTPPVATPQISTGFQSFTYLQDPYSQAEVDAALAVINSVSANALSQNGILLDQAKQDFLQAMTPPSVDEIAANYTEFVKVRVTGVLRTF